MVTGPAAAGARMVAQVVFRLQTRATPDTAETSTVLGRTPTRGSLTSHSPPPDRWIVLTPVPVLTFTAGGAGAYGPAISGLVFSVYANSFGLPPVIARPR